MHWTPTVLNDYFVIVNGFNFLGYFILLVHIMLADLSTYNFPVIIWWWKNVYPHEDLTSFKYIDCGGYRACLSTSDRFYLDDSRTKGIIFYGTRVNPHDLPLPRKLWHVWNLIHEESPMNNYLLSHEEFISLFNFTATFRRESDYPLTTQSIYSLDYLTKRKPMSTEEKNRKIRESGNAPVLYVQSHSDVASDRDAYVEQLMRYVKIDSFGKCLHNKDLPESMREAVISYEDEQFMDFISYYKFHIAFENAICRDYMTEKLFRALHVGSVPIYMGSPDVQDWMPNNRSVILARDFGSPEELAKYLEYLNKNDEEYNKFLEYKSPGGITNSFLKNHLQDRSWSTHPSESTESNDLNKFEGFECFVCRKLHEVFVGDGDKFAKVNFSHKANNSHMGCPEPRKFSLSTLNFSSGSTDFHWTKLYAQQKNTATAARRMVESGEKYSSELYK
ncbi:alpha-(1,3)-fucosyltransferase 11-like [Saccostrea echinata]|uniref:alpha-(1,3)-fucosyltransferase 11-like n=1 Tax=Saccostrea echinata TaxID=191078 RepID=UPI002A7F9D1D|nr:alpha-(1,3)-fucosyltransferase 11-like [Saccostrea echinata]